MSLCLMFNLKLSLLDQTTYHCLRSWHIENNNQQRLPLVGQCERQKQLKPHFENQQRCGCNIRWKRLNNLSIAIPHLADRSRMKFFKNFLKLWSHLEVEKQSGNSESLLSQIYANNEMTKRELNGSQLVLKLEWSLSCALGVNSIFPTDFDAIWGSNRTHPILTDLEARRLQNTLILAENWMVEIASNDVNNPETPGSFSTKNGLCHTSWTRPEICKRQNEEILSYALFNHLTESWIFRFCTIKENNPDLEWCIPTKESYVNSPISYGNRRSLVIEDIFCG